MRTRNTGILLLDKFGDQIRSSTFFVVSSPTRINDNFMNVSNGVTSPDEFSYHCILHYFFTMPVAFNFIFHPQFINDI